MFCLALLWDLKPYHSRIPGTGQRKTAEKEIVKKKLRNNWIVQLCWATKIYQRDFI